MTCHTQPSKDDLFRARKEQAKRRFHVIQGGQSDLECVLECNLPEQARRTDSPLQSDRAGGSLPHLPQEESRPLFHDAKDVTGSFHDWLILGAILVAAPIGTAIYLALQSYFGPLS